MTDLTVTCFYWSDPERRRDYSFNPGHVVILRDMVKRHLTVPHRFVCVTNEEIEFRDYWGIETIPLNMEKHVPGTVFARLWMRSPEFNQVLWEKFGGGVHPEDGSIPQFRIFNLDLDVVIVGSIDPIVDRDEESVFWRNPNYDSGGASRAFYQTSVQLFTAGSHPELWNDFDVNETTKWVNRRFGGAEQAWVSERLSWTEPFWDDKNGIYGAGRLFNGKPDSGIQTELPENARIVSFPGNRMPDQPEVQEMHPWISEHYK
jgi:hypothetical protein